jgi:hypothetical protein
LGWFVHENKALSFELYPNPTENKLTLSFPSNQNREISLLDLKGNSLLKVNSSDQQLALSLNIFSAGMYFVAVKENEQVSYQKICKK